MRFLWTLVLVIVAVVAALVIWMAMRPAAVEEIAEEPGRVFSDHDSGLIPGLGDRALDDASSQHDSGIDSLLRDSRGQVSAHDSGIAAALQERASATD